ncbi:hypothetical protein ACKWTF_013770 [Chironomus riparius]
MNFLQSLKTLKNHIHICGIYPFILTIYGFSKIVEKIFGIGSIWVTMWKILSANIGETKEFRMAIMSPLWIILIYYLTVAFFFYIRRVKFFKPYKIQPDVKNKFSAAEINEIRNSILFNQFVILPLCFWAVYHLFLHENHPMLDFETIPTFPVVFSKILINLMIFEFTFYYFHRAFHHKWIYKYFHKQHHKFTAPFALVVQYSHPLEYVICDVIAPGIGLFVTKCDAATALAYSAVVTSMTVIYHCGYHLPFLMSPEAHDYHHAYYYECFGSNGLMDFLHGTSKNFIKSERFKMHQTFWGIGTGCNKKVD